jgi:hypothetical protein
VTHSCETPLSVQSAYIIEKRDKKSDTWERVSDGVLGTLITIGKLKEGHEYEFRVIAQNANGASEPLVTDKPVLAKNPFDRPDAPGKPDCATRSLNHIEVNWRPPVDDGGAPISCECSSVMAFDQVLSNSLVFLSVHCRAEGKDVEEVVESIEGLV